MLQAFDKFFLVFANLFEWGDALIVGGLELLGFEVFGGEGVFKFLVEDVIFEFIFEVDLFEFEAVEHGVVFEGLPGGVE